MNESNRNYLILLVIIIIFVAQCIYLNFTQDDAFISYRYVQNFTSGNGLVFNHGERVEGYTNFLWIIILSIFSGLGLNIIVISKILGVASGCVVLFLLYRISSLFFPKQKWLFPLFPSLLLTASSAFAYWSISGLETAFFVAMVLLSVYLYLTYSRLWIVICAVGTLTRPEGALIFGILFLHKLLLEKTPLRKSLFDLAGFVLLLLPFVIFKLYYFGSILPSPFYAKTGLSWEYVKSGLGYFWLFLQHYGLWGILYLMPLFIYKSIDFGGKLLVWLVYLYSAYVIIIGGDVLKVHRFFLPILPLLCLLSVLGLQKLYVKFKSYQKGRIIILFVVLAIAAVFFLLPYEWINGSKIAEKALVEKMQFAAGYLKAYYKQGFSVAVTTIGSISYYLGTEITIIDMLGLTDKYISRHPEKIEGITVTWKERKYNAQYVISRNPDFILFSTGYKPSAPAEKALLLNSKFRQNYYVIPIFSDKQGFYPVFKRKGSYLKENELFKDTRFLELFCEGAQLYGRGQFKEAIGKLKQVVLVCPKDFALVYEALGGCYYGLNDYSAAEKYLKEGIQIDDCSVMSHFCLEAIYQDTGRLNEAAEEKRKILLYDPNFQW